MIALAVYMRSSRCCYRMTKSVTQEDDYDFFQYYLCEILEHKFLGKCSFGQMYILAGVNSGKRTLGVMFLWQVFFWKIGFLGGVRRPFFVWF